MHPKNIEKIVFNVTVTKANAIDGLPPFITVPARVMERLAIEHNLEYKPTEEYKAYLCIAPNIVNWHSCTWTRNSDFWKYFQSLHLNMIGYSNFTVNKSNDERPCNSFNILATCRVTSIMVI